MRFEVGDLCRVRSQYVRTGPWHTAGSGLIFAIDRELYRSWTNAQTGQRESQDRLHILWGDGTVGAEPHSFVEPVPREGEVT